jgi:hypothetical protein
MLKICTKCKIGKDISEYFWHSRFKKYTTRCKKCTGLGSRKGIKTYSLTPKGKKAVNEASGRAYIKHRDKWIARAKARYAIKKGIIKKPDKCEVCEHKKPLQGHHTDYSKPLEVIFLCYPCHAEADLLTTRTHL